MRRVVRVGKLLTEVTAFTILPPILREQIMGAQHLLDKYQDAIEALNMPNIMGQFVASL